MSSHPIQPTWVPFRATVSSEEKLAFSLRLMEGESEGRGGVGRGTVDADRLSLTPLCAPSENWNTEKSSPTFHLGEVAHLQAEVQTGSHLPLQLFVDYCVATPSPAPDQNSSPYHFIVDSHG